MRVGSKLNYCLNALIKGFVKMGNFLKSKNRFKCIYLLIPQGIVKEVVLVSLCLKCKMEGYDAQEVEIKALKVEMGGDGVNGLRKDGR